MSTTTDGLPYPPATDALGNGHQWMQDMAEFLDSQWVPWTAYVPTFGGFTLGNGSLEAAYRRLFDTVDFRIKITMGSTSDVTGAFTVDFAPAGLPAAECDVFGDGHVIGAVAALEVDAPAYRVGVLVAEGAPAYGVPWFDAANTMSDTIPFTWDTGGDGDQLKMRGSYRIIP